MTGRQLYDLLTAALAEKYDCPDTWRSGRGVVFQERPPAWDFLSDWEQLALHAAAEQLEAVE